MVTSQSLCHEIKKAFALLVNSGSDCWSAIFHVDILTIFICCFLQLERDIMIWNHKTYVSRPLLVKEDQLIRKHRRWYSQFFSENSPRLSMKKETLAWWCHSKSCKMHAIFCSKAPWGVIDECLSRSLTPCPKGDGAYEIGPRQVNFCKNYWNPQKVG